MMKLHSRIPKKELTDTQERFNFLQGAHNLVIRMDEVHPNSLADGTYVFLIWVTDSKYFGKKIRQNLRSLKEDSWEFKLFEIKEGLFIIKTNVL